MYDAEDPGLVINELLVSLFLPAITVFVALWAIFRLYWNELLLSLGLPAIVPREGAGAVAVGYGRFTLLVLLTLLLLVSYIALYRRFLRRRLRKRGLV